MVRLRTELAEPVRLCNCIYECPAHPRDRLLHNGDKCYHVDGTFHKIYSKNRAPENEKTKSAVSFSQVVNDTLRECMKNGK